MLSNIENRIPRYLRIAIIFAYAWGIVFNIPVYAQSKPIPVRISCYLNNANTEYYCYNIVTDEFLFSVNREKPKDLFQYIYGINSADLLIQGQYLVYDPNTNSVSIRGNVINKENTIALENEAKQYKGLLARNLFVSSAERNPFSARQLRAPIGKKLDKETITDPFAKHYFFSGNQISLPNIYKAYTQTFNFNDNGTAFIISKYGDIITNHHVFNSSNRNNPNILNDGFVVVDGQRISMKGSRLIYEGYTDASLNSGRGIDMVIIRIPSLAGRDYIRLSQQSLKQDDSVFLLGHPKDLNMERVCSIGTVSNVNLEKCFFSSDNEARGGNSGGPLVNEKGELVGVIFALVQGGFTDYINSIDLNTIRKVMDRKRISTQ